jgi:quinol monooxygenase YgiN
MDATVGATFVCAVLAAAGTGVLVGRCIRVPRIDVIAWACAVAAIAVSLCAQALGAYHGFTSGTFRAVQLSAQLIAPLWLAWGMVELGGKTIAARFGAKLVTAALTVIGSVVLITDPLAVAAFGKTWPPASVHYQIIPKYVLELIAAVTVLTVVVMLLVAALRLRRDPQWRRPLIALGAAGGAAVAILGLRLNLPGNLAYPALCALCALVASYAGMTAVRVDLDELHGEAPAGRVTRPQSRSRDYDDARVFSAAAARRTGNGDGQPRGDEDWYQLDRGRSNGGHPPAGGYQPDGGYAMNGLEKGDRDHRRGEGYPEDEDYPVGPEGADYQRDEAADRLSDADRTAAWQPRTLGRGAALAGQAAAQPGPDTAAASASDRAVTERLYGLIAIYTLAEGRADEFDALAESVVEEVRLHEPDALVYAVHSVPNAPMQRIFYEVYRDQTAYEEHKRHPYIHRFDVERAKYVLATNVIELGTQQAKVSPLPGLSQLFGHTAGE